MPFNYYRTSVMIIPHALQNLNGESKAKALMVYKKTKRTVIAGQFAGVASFDGYCLLKDVAKCTLRAHAYKALLAILAGPALQAIALPVYLYTNGTRIAKASIALARFGATISRAEESIANWQWAIVDLMLFGEIVSISEDKPLLFIRNETVGSISEIMKDIGGASE